MIHLNVRTAYSLLQSTIRLEQYVMQMTERGSRAVAIADDAFYGVPSFLSYCQRYGVKLKKLSPVWPLFVYKIVKEGTKP